MDTALTRISISILMAATGGAHRSSAGRRRDDTGGSPNWVSSPGRHGRLVDVGPAQAPPPPAASSSSWRTDSQRLKADPSVGPSGVGRMLLADADRAPVRASCDRRSPAQLPFRSPAAGASRGAEKHWSFAGGIFVVFSAIFVAPPCQRYRPANAGASSTQATGAFSKI
uniref:Uncharacterized protein n=1 Tax=Setaria viridis TaxID=4556 RepID=A0A4U6UUW5_SETVI|nr:hypothetical protein SEVIR_4G027700v2 [Setaria viridis]